MVIDTGLSTTSTNPVQNKVITEALGTRATAASLAAVQAALTAAQTALSSSAAFATQIATMKSELQAYVDTQIAAADWMDRATIMEVCDDEISGLISAHNVNAVAHADIRALVASCVTLAVFTSHTSGGYDPVTAKNTSLHVTASDRLNWDASADAIEDHLDEIMSASIHLASGERTKWNAAATAVTTHIADGTIHVTEALKNTWTNAATGYTSHVSDVVVGNTAPHVSYTDRVNWNKAVTDLTAHMADKVLQTSVHLRAGERTAWNAAVQSLATHVSAIGIHVTSSDKSNWDAAASSIVSHVAIVTGNPHGTSASDVGAYTKAEADTKIQSEKTSLEASAQATVNALLAGGVRYVGTVETLTELYAVAAPKHGDAYIVTADPSLKYVDVDGDDVYQACVYVCVVASNGSHTWTSFSEPFTVDLSSLATDDEVSDAITAAISAHNSSASAHSAAITAFIAAINADVTSIRTSVQGLATSKLDKTAFNVHAQNYNNPHLVTAADVDTMTTDEIGDAIDDAEEAVIEAATTKINAMISSTLKWKGTVESLDTLMGYSLLSTAWIRGGDHPTGETFTPDYGFCYTVAGTAQMFVFLGVPEDLDTDTWTPTVKASAANYQALASLALASAAEVNLVTTVPTTDALITLAQQNNAVAGGRYKVAQNNAVYRFTSVPTPTPTSTVVTDWGWVAVDTNYSTKYGDRYWIPSLRKIYTFKGRPRTVDPDTWGPAGASVAATDMAGLGWELTPLTPAELEEWGWDDVGNVFNTSEILNQALAAAQALVTAHNSSGDAHPSIQSAINQFTSLKVHFPGDGGDVSTDTGYWTVGVNAILTRAVSAYSGLATTRQIVALTSLVDRLYAAYANKQCKITAGTAIKLTNLDAEQQVAAAGATPAYVRVEWDPTSILKKVTGTTTVDESFGLNFADGELYSTYNKKFVPNANGDGGVWHVVLGEAYATLKWLTDYVAGVATWTNINAELAKKQDLLTEGPGINIYTVVDTDHDETYTNINNETVTVTVADTTHLEISTVPEEEQSLELTMLRLYGQDGKWYDLRVNENGDLTTTEVVS